MWGQVVVALRDDDTTRRRRADADERTSIFGRNVGGEPPTGWPSWKTFPESTAGQISISKPCSEKFSEARKRIGRRLWPVIGDEP